MYPFQCSITHVGDDDAVNEKEGDDDDGGCSIPQLACSPRTVGDIVYNNDD